MLCSPVTEVYTLDYTGTYRDLLVQDLPSCRTAKLCVSHLIILGVAVITGPKCDLARGWREGKLGDLPVTFYLRSQVQTTESILGKQSRSGLCPALLCCTQRARQTLLQFGSPAAKTFELTPGPARLSQWVQRGQVGRADWLRALQSRGRMSGTQCRKSSAVCWGWWASKDRVLQIPRAGPKGRAV